MGLKSKNYICELYGLLLNRPRGRWPGCRRPPWTGVLVSELQNIRVCWSTNNSRGHCLYSVSRVGLWDNDKGHVRDEEGAETTEEEDSHTSASTMSHNAW